MAGWSAGGVARLVEAVSTVAASGAAQTIPPVTVATMSRITLTAAPVTLTFPAAQAGASFTLTLVQDGAGSRTVTWPAGTKWPGALVPTLSTAASAVDVLIFQCDDGSTWEGFVSGKGLA